MNATKISRRSVHENKQKCCDLGGHSQLSVALDLTGTKKTENSARIYASDVNVSPIIESALNLERKPSLSKEETSQQAKTELEYYFRDEAQQSSFQESYQGEKIFFPVNPDYRPVNFGTVSSGVFRSSFPVSEDFQYLQSLRLKTILTLVKKDENPEFQRFIEKNKICHKILDMSGTKKLEISEDMMRCVMKIVLDKSNYPILIHCNHGRHRTGCVVAAIRHLEGWDTKEIVQEYRDFAAPKERECDIAFITNFKISTLKYAPIKSTKDCINMPLSNRVLNRKTARILSLSIALITLFLTLQNFRRIGFSAEYNG